MKQHTLFASCWISYDSKQYLTCVTKIRTSKQYFALTPHRRRNIPIVDKEVRLHAEKAEIIFYPASLATPLPANRIQRARDENCFKMAAINREKERTKRSSVPVTGGHLNGTREQETSSDYDYEAVKSFVPPLFDEAE